MKSDLQQYVEARKRRDPEFADGYDAGYEEFKLGLLLRQAREEAGLTQDALAKRAKTPKTTIARIEANAEGAPLTVIDRLARALGKTLKVELVEAT
ncbi:MAG: helix-turn-helix transcriptional regulator [Verrucomicrobia bacterium]|nr:helix-turn-helix transcriptional regulator [Verrucomicrobiota bacterium]